MIKNKCQNIIEKLIKKKLKKLLTHKMFDDRISLVADTKSDKQTKEKPIKTGHGEVSKWS